MIDQHEQVAFEVFKIITDHEDGTLGGQKAACRAVAEWHLGSQPSVKVSDGDVWLVFPNTLISIEGICSSGAPGPIVKRNLKQWRDALLTKEANGEDDISDLVAGLERAADLFDDIQERKAKETNDD